MPNSVREQKDEKEPKKSDQSWTDWQTKLYIFQEWRKEKHNPLVRAWWSYLFSVFFREVSILSNSTRLCLDVGCGSGGYLCRLVKDYDFGIGLDPLKSSLKSSKASLKRNGISDKVDLILGVGEHLPLKSECIDLCIMAGSLDHVNEPAQAIREIHWVLSRGGYLMLLETALIARQSSFYDETHVNQFTLTDLKRLLKQFTIERILKKVPVFSQIHLPDLLGYGFLHKMLGSIPGVISSYFNYSEVLLECKKN
jgi:SAM-dependent methyltransferase